MKKISCLLVCLATLPVALAAPKDVRLRFDMSFAGIPIAEVVDTLTFTEDGYSMESLAMATGVADLFGVPPLNRYSTGKLDADGNLLMVDFRDERGEKVREVEMDHATGEVSWISDKGESGSATSDDKQVFNSLTVVYAPYAIGELPADGDAFMATGRRFYSYGHSTEKQEEKLKVDAGEFEVWRQQRLNHPRGAQYYIWFAPELDNLPVKISIGGLSGTIEMELVEVDYDFDAN